MVLLTISVTAQSNKRNELLSALRLFTDKTDLEKGCQACRIYQDVDNGNLINLEETWVSRSELDAHFRSDIFSALLGAVKLLGETHEIRINTGSQTEGMAVVEMARTQLRKVIS